MLFLLKIVMSGNVSETFNRTSRQQLFLNRNEFLSFPMDRNVIGISEKSFVCCPQRLQMACTPAEDLPQSQRPSAHHYTLSSCTDREKTPDDLSFSTAITPTVPIY